MGRPKKGELPKIYTGFVCVEWIPASGWKFRRFGLRGGQPIYKTGQFVVFATRCSYLEYFDLHEHQPLGDRCRLPGFIAFNQGGKDCKHHWQIVSDKGQLRGHYILVSPQTGLISKL